MSMYYCHLGNTPELSLYELQVMLPNQSVELLLPNVAKIELADDRAAQELLQTTGGLVKIYRHLEEITTPTPEALTEKIIAHLTRERNTKVTFGLFAFGTSSPELDTAAIKHELKSYQVNSRYVDAEPPYGVAAAVLLKGKVRELVVITTDTHTLLAETVAVQDINDWTKRDRMKPYADRKKGMLPPKVARMMVNIGLGLLPKNTAVNTAVLLDPFMGSGTVLMEALMRGARVEGHDLDEHSVRGAQENLEWFSAEYGLTADFVVAQRDATQRFITNPKPQFDVIVTEPFLGKPTPKERELPNMFKGLYKLYLGVFKNWTTILKPNAPIVIVFPFVETPHHTFSLANLIDKLEDLGYTSVSQSIVYSRPQAIVQRQIHFFRYNPR